MTPRAVFAEMDHRERVRALVLAVVTVVALVLLVVVPGSGIEPGHTRTRPIVPCEEDDECWDCQSMGNHICGDVTTTTWTVRQAESHALVRLDSLKGYCAESGQAAEAWAEANSDMPHGFEIIGQCVGRLAA